MGLSMWSWISSLGRLLVSIPPAVLTTNCTRADVPDYEDAVYDPALLSRRFCLPTNVRLWLITDISKDRELGPLYTRKQTSKWVPLYVC